MFTRTIRSHILGKSNVKWDPNNSGALDKQYNAIMKSYDINNDTIVNPGEIAVSSRDIAADVKNLKAIESNSKASPEMQRKASELIKSLQTTKNKITESTIQVVDDYRDEIGLSAQSQALSSLLSPILVNDKESQETLSDMKRVNIVSLLKIIDSIHAKNLDKKQLRELGYTSNGSFGMFEVGDVKDFVELYNAKKNNPDFSKVMKTAIEYAKAGLDPTRVLIDSRVNSKLSASNVVEYLGSVPSGRFTQQEVLGALNAISNETGFAKSIAHISGLNGVSDMTTLAQAFQADPTAKARFFDQLNASAATSTVGLKAFLLGFSVESIKMNNAVIQQQASAAYEKAKDQVSSATNPEQKQQAQAIIDSLDAKGGVSWLTGEIQKVSQAAFLNVGKDALSAGAGMTFETFVRGLTVSLGAGVGEGGKIMPAAVIHYGTGGELMDTKNAKIRGNVGVGSTVLPVVIPFVDGGLSYTDKITTIGGAIGDTESYGVQLQWMKVGGVLMLSRMNERADEIAQRQAKLVGSIAEMATLSPLDERGMEAIIKKLGAQDTKDAKQNEKNNKNAQKYALEWTNKVKELYRVHNASDADAGVKSVLLYGLVQSEIEKSWVEEANNDKDRQSYKGASIGVGQIFGITFPVAGIALKRTEGHYGKSVEKEYPVLDPLKVSNNNNGSGSDINKKDTADKMTNVREIGFSQVIRQYIYSANRNPGEKIFNQAIAQISNQEYSRALDILLTAKTHSVIPTIIHELGGAAKIRQNPSVLATILTYTYGVPDIQSKEKVKNADYKKARKDNVIAAEKELAKKSGRDTDGFEMSGFATREEYNRTDLKDYFKDQELSLSVYATPLHGDDRIDKFEGSMTVADMAQHSLSPSQKEAVMNEHNAQIEEQVKEINEVLFRGEGSVMTIDSYKEILRTGKIDARLQSLGLDFQNGHKPQFFLALAMAHGNVCMNRVEGLAYPRLHRNGTKQPDARIQLLESIGHDNVATSASSTETNMAIGIAKMDNKKKPDIEKTNMETKIEVREVQVSPNDITEVNGNGVIVANPGGTRVEINMDTLTRDQYIKLTSGQSVNLNVKVPVNTPVIQYIPGGNELTTNEAFAITASSSLPVGVKQKLEKLINNPKFKFKGE